MSSVGALLDHLTRERAVGELDDDGLEGLEITGIESLSLSVNLRTYDVVRAEYFHSDQFMQINADALS